ncbi:hypothetical protein GCM10007897_40680 [Sphingobium jiangsuense]|nr:hypothetical protein GCM10007897_40680 [Sphingobium jiangsuense]
MEEKRSEAERAAEEDEDIGWTEEMEKHYRMIEGMFSKPPKKRGEKKSRGKGKGDPRAFCD